MRKETVKDFIVISHSNVTQFENLVKQFLESHKKATQLNILSSTTTEAGSTAHIYYEEIKYIAEDIKEEFLLNGERYTCSNCPYYGANGSDNPRDAFTCMRKVENGQKRASAEACLFFYQELAKGGIKPV